MPESFAVVYHTKRWCNNLCLCSLQIRAVVGIAKESVQRMAALAHQKIIEAEQKPDKEAKVCADTTKIEFARQKATAVMTGAVLGLAR